MKKTYIAPTMKSYEIEVSQMVCASLQGNEEKGVDTPDVLSNDNNDSWSDWSDDDDKK